MAPGKRFAVATACLLLMVAACGPTEDDGDVAVGSSGGTEAQQRRGQAQTEGEADDQNPCAALWQQTREQARSEGERDGEARRQADEARAECEAKQRERNEGDDDPDGRSEVQCEPGPRRVESWDDAQKTGRAGIMVFFGCEHQATERGFPVHEFNHGDEDGEPGQRLATAVEAYLEGPDDAITEAGYTSALGETGANSLNGVTVDNGAAKLSFTQALADDSELGSSAVNDAFLAQIVATALQFPEIDTVQFEMDGSCKAFWEELYGGPECFEPIGRSQQPGFLQP